MAQKTSQKPQPWMTSVARSRLRSRDGDDLVTQDHLDGGGPVDSCLVKMAKLGHWVYELLRETNYTNYEPKIND